MPVESECALDTVSFHENERHTVGKADVLIGQFFKISQRFEFIFMRRSQNGQDVGRHDGAGPIGGEGIASPAGQEGKGLIEDEIALI
jgi:hypothetical protein